MMPLLSVLATWILLSSLMYRTQKVEGSQPATENRRNEEMKMQVYM
jgi:hypothetical protein